MLVSEMYEKVNFNISAIYSDKRFIDSVILAELNRVLKEIAGYYCIGTLQKTKIITLEAYEDSITGYEAKTRLPADYGGHGIYRARNATQERDIAMMFPNVSAMKAHYNGTNLTGSVEALAWDGTYVWGLLCPETAEDIAISYYNAPTALAEDADEPDFLPTRLHEGLLVDGATVRLLKRIPEETKSGGANMKYYLEENASALGQLAETCKSSPKVTPYYDRHIQYF